MAVRAAQYLSNVSSQDLRNRVRSNAFEQLPVLQDADGAHHTGNLIDASTQGLTQSELTSNASGSRKRSRDHLSSTTLSQPQPSSGTPTRHQFPMKTSDSTCDSPAADSTALSPLLQDLGPQLYQQSVEIDALVRLQSERLRSGFEEAAKRHRRALFSVLGQQVAKRLREKDAELACASRRSAELEEKVRQMASESQIWFNIARNNEAIASSLRTTLDQVVLVQNTDGHATLAEADDAQSCCFEGAEKEELRWRMGCRVCRERVACVLLLPCRHLCLCNACEPILNSCPVCHSTKNATLQIFMS